MYPPRFNSQLQEDPNGIYIHYTVYESLKDKYNELSPALASLQGYVKGEAGDTITEMAENKIKRLEKELAEAKRPLLLVPIGEQRYKVSKMKSDEWPAGSTIGEHLTLTITKMEARL